MLARNLVTALLLCLLLATPSWVVAQSPGTPASDTVSPSPDATAPELGRGSDGPPELDQATVDNALAVLEDDERRQQVIDTLKALHALGEEDPASAPLGYLQEQIDARTKAVREAVDAVVVLPQQVPTVGSWFLDQVESEPRRAFWARTLGGIGFVLLASIAAAWLVARLLKTWRKRLENQTVGNMFAALPILAARLVLAVLPIAAFVGFAVALGEAFDFGRLVELVAAELVKGIAFVSLASATAGVLLTYSNPSQQLLPVGPTIGKALHHSIRRMLVVAGYGYFALEAGLRLGMPWTIHAFLLHLLFLVTLGQFVVLVLRNRRPMAIALRGMGRHRSGGLLESFLPWETLAKTWHLGAIAYGVTIYAIWSVKVPGGAPFLFQATLLTLLLLALARGLNLALSERATQRPKPQSEDDDDDLTQVVAAATHSPLVLIARLFILLVALTLLIEIWGGEVLGWLASPEGEAVRERLIAAGLTIAGAYLLWKALGGTLRSMIDERDMLGQPLRSQRSQTLLTILRNVLFLAIWVTALMLMLSELGLNLAPLLAGAGVIGLAIGFGSQKLVQDMLTGFFILVEDTISVGDVVDVGGKVGVVEAVTLRTVRLRGYDGQVHTVPFSGIDVVSNLTKDFSYYVFDIGVGYQEDVDRVMQVMADVGRDLRRDRKFRRLILDDLEVAGVDQFADSAVVIKARIKTRPMQQWDVGREYRRLLKKRFDALGIEIPYPHQTVFFGEVRGGRTPAAPVDLSGASWPSEPVAPRAAAPKTHPPQRSPIPSLETEGESKA